MLFIQDIPGYLYHPLYLYIVVLLCFCTSFYYLSSTGNKLISESKDSLAYITVLLAGVIILFLGLRPYSKDDMLFFGDTWLYAHSYNMLINGYTGFSDDSEWLWNNIAFFCKQLKFNENEYFLFIEAIYVIPMVISCFLLTRRNIWVSFLFCLVSFSFYAYGVNGIRNGAACSLLMLSLACFEKNIYRITLSILLAVAAYSIHNSTMLIIACVIVSTLLIKSPKNAIAFWAFSILISLLMGDVIGNFFEGIGFGDDRTRYFKEASETEYAQAFSSTGFRFDFLLYSAMPVLLVGYLTIKRNFNDVKYNIIANTYILANSFWIMVIRSNFSNRFAYLSWFLYPIVVVYPLIRFNIWESQDRNSAIILIVYTSFTLVMFLIR